MIPEKTVVKKFPFIFSQKIFRLTFLIRLKFLQFKLSIESKRFLYMPVIKAIVPPEMPGIKSATPINIPLPKRRIVFFFNKNKYYLLTKV